MSSLTTRTNLPSGSDLNDFATSLILVPLTMYLELPNGPVVSSRCLFRNGPVTYLTKEEVSIVNDIIQEAETSWSDMDTTPGDPVATHKSYYQQWKTRIEGLSGGGFRICLANLGLSQKIIKECLPSHKPSQFSANGIANSLFGSDGQYACAYRLTCDDEQSQISFNIERAVLVSMFTISWPGSKENCIRGQCLAGRGILWPDDLSEAETRPVLAIWEKFQLEKKKLRSENVPLTDVMAQSRLYALVEGLILNSNHSGDIIFDIATPHETYKIVKMNTLVSKKLSSAPDEGVVMTFGKNGEYVCRITPGRNGAAAVFEDFTKLTPDRFDRYTGGHSIKST